MLAISKELELVSLPPLDKIDSQDPHTLIQEELARVDTFPYLEASDIQTAQRKVV